GRNLLDLEVFRQGTTTPATPTSAEKTPQASLQTFSLGVRDEGTWTVRVKRASKSTEDVPYTLNVLFLERHLDYSFSFDNVHVATIELREEGRGVYAATFDQTSTPGVYVFNAVLDWDDARTGRTHREERLEEFVKSKADPAKSEMTTGRPDARTVTVSVTPRDRYGNFLGPRAAVTATLRSAGNLAGPVDRDQTGTYVFTVTDVPARETPDLEISVDGTGVGNTR